MKQDKTPNQRLDDLDPREPESREAGEVKGGLEPDNGLRLTIRPANLDPPDG